MKPKVSIASLLLLLSAITTTENQKPNNTHDLEILSNQEKAPSLLIQCKDYNDIAWWMREQLHLNTHLKKFQTDLDFILSSLNKKTPLKKCNFYEENTLQLIIENVNGINKANGSQIEQLEPHGDLEKNLETILPQIKEVVPKGIKSCCENLDKLFENLKDDLRKQVQDLTRKLNEVNSENSTENDAFQNKLKDLENQLKEIKPSLEMLQKQMGDNDQNNKCCIELKSQVQELENKQRLVKNEKEDQAHRLGNQLEDLKNKQKNAAEIATNLKKATEDKPENIKQILEQCDKNCVKINGSEDNPLLDLEKKIENLQKLVETVSNKFIDLDIPESSTNLSVTINTCLENGETLSKIQSQLQNLLRLKNETCFVRQNCSSNEELRKNIKELQQKGETLRNDLKKFPKCCQKIDELILQVASLENMLKDMNQTYNDQLKANTNQFNTIKEAMDDALKKLADKKKSNNNDDLRDQIKDLKKVLDKAKVKFEILEDRQNGLLKDKDSIENSTYSPDELAILKKDFDEFKQDVERMIKDFEDLGKFRKDTMQRLEKFNNDVSQDLDKIKENLSPSDELEKQVKDHIEEQKKQANLMLDCKNRCMKIDKINDLIDRVEDLEKVLKKSRTRRRKPK